MSPPLAGVLIAALIITIVLGGRWLERHLAQDIDLNNLDTDKDH